MGKYVLTLQRRKMVCREVFVGSWWGLLMYRFRMRKWKVVKIEKSF